METLYEIEENTIYGRYIIAARDLKQGEIIMKEKPRMLGSQISAFQICLKCACRIYTLPTPCSKCEIAPICGFCDGNFHTAECEAMKDIRTKVPGLNFKFLCDYPQVSMPLRCLLLKYYDNMSWNQLVQMESHLKERKETYIYNLHRNHVELPLYEINLFHLLNLEKDIIQIICGILDINTFEVRPKDFKGPEDCLRGLYIKPALMAHDCLSNTHLSVDDDFIMTIRASLNITKGTMITFNYTNGLQGNYERQNHLQQGKLFSCGCKRCADPTELGTGLSTLICPKCKQKSLLCKETKWQCIDCLQYFNTMMICTTLSLAKDLIQNTLESGTLQDSRNLVKLFKRSFHPQHYFIMEINQKIISMLSYETDLSSIQEKILLCKELITVLQLIEPGISRHQGIAQYELHNALIQLGKLQYNSSLLTTEKYLELLQETEGILKTSIGHLIYEPKSTPEGRLAQKALTDLQVLRGTIKQISNRVQKKSKKHK